MRKTIEGVDFAVDEHIWGHRLYDEQLPHLTVLEFLSVLGSNLDKPLQAGPTDRVKYRPQRQIRLRALLFNNPFVESVSEKSIADDQKWSEWNKLFGADIDSLEFGDTAYLKDVFQHLKLKATSGGPQSLCFRSALIHCMRIYELRRKGMCQTIGVFSPELESYFI
jgi:hypothetical protein